jgi:hypothetical protein
MWRRGYNIELPDARLSTLQDRVRQQPGSVPGGGHAHMSELEAYKTGSPEAHVTLQLAVDRMLVLMFVRRILDTAILLLLLNNPRSTCRGHL